MRIDGVAKAVNDATETLGALLSDPDKVAAIVEESLADLQALDDNEFTRVTKALAVNVCTGVIVSS